MLEGVGFAALEIVGDDLSGLQHEAGGHRIQRIPPTERRGRVHTSTVTVAVVDPDKPKPRINDTDFRVEWFSGTGKGGQHRNKHQNSCRVIHDPTGLTQSATGRERQANLTQAKAALIRLLEEGHNASIDNAENAKRRQQVGSGMRGDKRRTYRFQDDSVQDHITNRAAACRQVLRGAVDLLWP